MYNFCNAVYAGTNPSPSFEDGAYVNKIMQAAYDSDVSGKSVTVE